MHNSKTQTTPEGAVVFFGTPYFAARCLQELHHGGIPIAGVVTAPDRPAGRGQKLNVSPVKQYALEHQLPLAQPERLKSPEFLACLRSWNPRLQVVVAFRMLPEIVWNAPPLGTLNLHASLLPAYRGAAPIQWAIIRGETVTGVTTFRLRHEIDTGDLIGRQSVAIGHDTDAGTLLDQLLEAGAPLLRRDGAAVLGGTALYSPQSAGSGEFPHAPKLTPETGRINWQSAAADVHNLVRGLAPTPGAHTQYRGQPLKILRTRKLEGAPALPAGQTSLHDGAWLVGCGDAPLSIELLQPAGSRAMSAMDFLRGRSAMQSVRLGEGG